MSDIGPDAAFTAGSARKPGLGFVRSQEPSLTALVPAIGIVFSVEMKFIVRIVIVADAGKLNPIERPGVCRRGKGKSCSDQNARRREQTV
jgi:hypothetical protein